jgi:hypothetical protein
MNVEKLCARMCVCVLCQLQYFAVVDNAAMDIFMDDSFKNIFSNRRLKVELLSMTVSWF